MAIKKFYTEVKNITKYHIWEKLMKNILFRDISWLPSRRDKIFRKDYSKAEFYYLDCPLGDREANIFTALQNITERR